MSKRKNKVEQVEQVVAVETTEEAAAPVLVIALGSTARGKLGGTRALWYDAMAAAEGKPIVELLANAPELSPKGSVKGRLAWLVRKGYFKLVAQS